MKTFPLALYKPGTVVWFTITDEATGKPAVIGSVVQQVKIQPGRVVYWVNGIDGPIEEGRLSPFETDVVNRANGL